MRTSKRDVVLFSLVLFCLAARLHASCGSASCPLDSNAFNQPAPRGWALDLSFQYIDQDQPRIGTHEADVGELPTDHDEVRTLNRSAAVRASYAWSPELHFGVTVPYVSRFHEHLESEGHEPAKHEGGEPGVSEEWQLQGLGDIALGLERRLWSAGRTSLWGTAAIELPSGPDDLDNDDGEVAEQPIQPGSGSTDAILGVVLRGAALRQTRREGGMGNTSAIPWFASVSFRRNGKGREDYRVGDEWQAYLGAAYPVAQRVDALLQLNARWRGKDAPGTSGEDPDFTGGSFLFVSPGARVQVGGGWSAYGYLQLPIRQDVNGEQLTASHNWLFGIQTAF